MRVILASKSEARRAMLKNAGLEFDAQAAPIDETKVKEDNMQASPVALAGILANEKALSVSSKNPDALVIGSDQILEFDGQLLSKAKSPEMARGKLQDLKGRTHNLISAVAVCQNGQKLWQHTDIARLKMQDFDEAFLEKYCEQAGRALTANVGAYALEDVGVHLFESIEGDYFTILGMPLLPLLRYLREDHGVSL